jgi:hypothetical protein
MERSASHGPAKGQKSDGITRFAKECYKQLQTSDFRARALVLLSPVRITFSISAPHHESGRFSAQIVRHEEPATSHAPWPWRGTLTVIQYELNPSFVSSASLHSLRSTSINFPPSDMPFC